MTERELSTPHFSGAAPNSEEPGEDGPISLKPLVKLLVAYRFVIALAMAGAVILSGALVLAAALVLPSERMATMKVRLLFDGAADGHYPNGTGFSPAEVIATPVLSEVYRANDLQRFYSYDDFKDSMAILHSSLEQDLLASFYAARLADTKLTAVERAGVEDEYRKKREAVKDPVFALTMLRKERLQVMPVPLIEKTLNDTLAAWARQADELKGATHFNIPVFSRSVLTADILKRDFLMAADDLRVQAHRAADVAEQLMILPGATTIRTRKDHVSLAEVNFALLDTLRNKIEPVVYLIQERGLTNDRQAMVQYLHGHVVEIGLERDATNARIHMLEDALQGYTSAKAGRPRESVAAGGSTGRAPSLDTQTIIPQVSDSFLNRLVEMSAQSQNSDVEYRQKLTTRIIKEGEVLAELERSTAYYDGLAKTVTVHATTMQAAEGEAVREELKEAFGAVSLAVDQLGMLYEEFSAQRLNPAAALYTVTEPFAVQTRRSLSLATAGLCVTLALMITLLVAPVGCAIHQSSRGRGRRS